MLNYVLSVVDVHAGKCSIDFYLMLNVLGSALVTLEYAFNVALKIRYLVVVNTASFLSGVSYFFFPLLLVFTHLFLLLAITLRPRLLAQLPSPLSHPGESYATRVCASFPRWLAG